MLVEPPYGKGFAKVSIPEQAKVVYPREVFGVTDARREIRRAMNEPIGCEPL